ncbi:UNVERIFIED_CONTAM: putative LRR receptor-like serine/threonine-protein kinase [Sesamum radiatum]|uniref:LRR receptor-like serine/threonine-protein kinase n=1 Tax=Sesamum radiatum TaxID=300843 RepID=A0AAW2K3U3_SESRA
MLSNKLPLRLVRHNGDSMVIHVKSRWLGFRQHHQVALRVMLNLYSIVTAQNFLIDLVSVVKSYNLPGVLPVNIVKLPYLQEISVLVNRLSGEIPKEFGNITSLTYLNLEANNFSGPIPSDIGKLINLKTLILSSNQLTGQLPTSFSALKNLNDLINDNNLSGRIPDFIQNWKQLNRSDVSFNKLVGQIPNDIARNLKIVFVTGNMLSGNIPDTIFKDGSNMYVLFLLYSVGYFGFILHAICVAVCNLNKNVFSTFEMTHSETDEGVTFLTTILLGEDLNALVKLQDGTLEIRFYWASKGTTRIPNRGDYGSLVSAISVNPYFEGLELQTVAFSLKQIKAATNNFDATNKIGEGGFGPVYKGLLPDGTVIAVKQLSSKSRQGNREFLNEIGMISCLQHPNLVRLHGCCIEGDQLLLVYEYMENNSLAYVLFDVYSFGVVIFEIVSGKSNNNYMPSHNFVCLLDWACHLHESKNVDELIDERLGSEFNKEEVERMVKVAVLCTNATPSVRPTMSEVVQMMEGKLEIPDAVPVAGSTYTSDVRFKAMKDFHQQKTKESSSSGTGSTDTQINSTTMRRDAAFSSYTSEFDEISGESVSPLS